jgi:hypothetical protein
MWGWLVILVLFVVNVACVVVAFLVYPILGGAILLVYVIALVGWAIKEQNSRESDKRKLLHDASGRREG